MKVAKQRAEMHTSYSVYYKLEVVKHAVITSMMYMLAMCLHAGA